MKFAMAIMDNGEWKLTIDAMGRDMHDAFVLLDKVVHDHGYELGEYTVEHDESGDEKRRVYEVARR